jgi:hypothetical protein
MMDQYIRNAISFVGAFVFVFGGLYLVDYYSGWRPFADWRPFEGAMATTEMKERMGAVSPMAEAGSAAHRVSNDFSGRHDTVTDPKQIFRCDVYGKAVSSIEPCGNSVARGRHR